MAEDPQDRIEALAAADLAPADRLAAAASASTAP